MELTRRCLIFCLIVVALVTLSHRPAVAEEPDPKKEAAARLERMQARAAATKIAVVTDEATQEVELRPAPIFRYDDQPRRILDGTLWAWGDDSGRPVAICKVEDYVSNEGPRLWVQCLTSLSTQRISANWEDGRTWSASKPGVTLKQLLGAPSPAGNARLRLTQLRRMARRFAATLIDPRNNDRQEMRLLPQPIHRYRDPQRGVIDAAIFGLASNGTNPDACFILEIRQADQAEPVWEFAVAAMTAHAVEIKLDDRTVWTKEFTGNPEGYDNWMFFSVPQE